MKKILILALVVSITSVAFAETKPVFSGTFSTYWKYSLDEKGYEKVGDDYSISAKIDLAATIDEWNTLTVEVETKDDVFYENGHVYTEDKAKAKAEVPGRDTEVPIYSRKPKQKKKNDFLRLKNLNITTNVTGALGAGDLPVQVSTKIGDFKFKDVNVSNVSPVSTNKADGGEADGGIGMQFNVDLFKMVTVSTVLYPKTLLNDRDSEKKPDGKPDTEAGLTIKATDILGMLDLAAFFISSETDFATDMSEGDNFRKVWNEKTEEYVYVLDENDLAADDDTGVDMGFSAAVKLLDGGLKLGLGFVNKEVADNETENGMQFDVGFSKIEKLNVGLSFGVANIDKFEETASVKFGGSYDITDALGVYAGFGLPFKGSETEDKSTDFAYDVGVNTALKGLKIQLGFANRLEYKSPSDSDKWIDTIFLKFSTSF